MKTMPPGAGGSLPECDYFAIVAFVLKSNGTSFDSLPKDDSDASVALGWSKAGDVILKRAADTVRRSGD